MLYLLRVAWALAKQDVQDLYGRSVIGPFWITLGLVVQIAAIGVVFGILFAIDTEEYLPFLTVSLVIWSYVTQTINEASSAYLNSAQLMKQLKIPSLMPVVRSNLKGLIFLVHHVPVILLVFVLFQVPIGPEILSLVPGFILFAANLFWLSVVAATLNARYRDVGPMISAILTISFYATPVIWPASRIPEPYYSWVVNGNPAYHLMEIVRAPVLGEIPAGINWIVNLILVSVGLAVFNWIRKKFQPRIVFWV